MNYLPKYLQAVYFDVDGTLAKSNIVYPLLYIKKKTMSTIVYRLWSLTLPFRFIYWTILDKRNRKMATISIYKQYKGISIEKMKALKVQCYKENYENKLFSDALEMVNSLKNKGAKIILVSGSLDIFLEPLAEKLDAELISSQLETKNGAYTGVALEKLVSGEQKAYLINQHAINNKYSLDNCASFGDSYDDIPMLCSVKYPVVINPDKKLLSLAKKNNWITFNWS